jgi:hypothetical protein
MKKTLLFLFAWAHIVALRAQSVQAVGGPFVPGGSMTFSYTGAPGNPTDWIGVYNIGETPDGDPPSLVWDYVSGPAGSLTLPGALPVGDYAVHLFCCDGYDILASATFTVAGTPAATITTPLFFKVDSTLTFDHTGGTGSPLDWVGIYAPGAVPGTDLSLAFSYVSGPEGSVSFPSPGLPAGDYVANLFCCDGYSVLATTSFTIFENLAPSLAPDGLVAGQPVVFNFTGGTGSILDWVGIYKAGEVPDGDPASEGFQYVDGINGSVSFSPATFQDGVAYDAHLFCCDGYTILASYENFTLTSSTGEAASAQTPWFRCVPSPAREVVHVQFGEPVEGQFTVFSLTGQAVRSLAVNGQAQLDIRDLPRGAYIGQLASAKGTQAQRIIVE